MSQQNFILQINLFMEFGKRNRLTSYERMFWLGLFHFANELAQQNPNHEWPDDFFPVQNSDFSLWTGLEERNIRSIKNRFRQMRLIDFKKGDGKKVDPEYRLFYLRYIGYKIVPDTVGDSKGNRETGDKNAPDTVGGSVGDSVGDAVTDTVGDNQDTGDKNAPDTVTDANTLSRNPNILNNININRGREKASSREKAEAGTYSARARETLGRHSGSNPQSCPQGRGNGGGFVDLENEQPYAGGGFVPLPWDEGV